MSDAGGRVGMDAPNTLPRALDVENFAKVSRVAYTTIVDGNRRLLSLSNRLC